MKILCDRCKREYEVPDDYYNPVFQGDYGEEIKLKEEICPECKADSNLENF